jgi:peptidoglycan/xylan/chitin deacetylase (PgdA/CDA1 family)
VILEPNKRRRRRLFRAIAGIVLIAVIAVVGFTSRWTLPTFSFAFANATPSPAPTTLVAAATDPPTPAATLPPTEPPPTPAPTPGPDGCIPPPPDLQPATVVSHGPRTGKQVALTFDDGNNAPNVLRIVKFLTARHINATFFPTARAVELAPSTWQTVSKAGFPIANHTYHHQDLTTLCYERQLAELEKAKAVNAANQIAVQGYMRPPFEAFNGSTRLAAAAAGEAHVVLWGVDTLDWTGLGKWAIYRRAIVGGPGSIILFHTSSAATLDALGPIVGNYLKRGFTFVTVGQMLGVPGPVPFP